MRESQTDHMGSKSVRHSLFQPPYSFKAKIARQEIVCSCKLAELAILLGFLDTGQESGMLRLE